MACQQTAATAIWPVTPVHFQLLILLPPSPPKYTKRQWISSNGETAEHRRHTKQNSKCWQASRLHQTLNQGSVISFLEGPHYKLGGPHQWVYREQNWIRLIAVACHTSPSSSCGPLGKLINTRGRNVNLAQFCACLNLNWTLTCGYQSH